MAMWMCTSRTCKIRREGTVGAKHGMSGMLMLVVPRVFAKLSIGVSSATRRSRYRRNAKSRLRQAWRVLEKPLVLRDRRQQKGKMRQSSHCCLIFDRKAPLAGMVLVAYVCLRSAYGPIIGWYTGPCHGGQREKAVKIKLPFSEAT